MRSRCALLLLRRPPVVGTEGAGERAESPGVSHMLLVRDTAAGAPAAIKGTASFAHSNHGLCP